MEVKEFVLSEIWQWQTQIVKRIALIRPRMAIRSSRTCIHSNTRMVNELTVSMWKEQKDTDLIFYKLWLYHMGSQNPLFWDVPRNERNTTDGCEGIGFSAANLYQNYDVLDVWDMLSSWDAKRYGTWDIIHEIWEIWERAL